MSSRTSRRGWKGATVFRRRCRNIPRCSTGSIIPWWGAGEKGGLLAEILSRLATYLENTARLRKKVKSSLMYPVAVTIVAIGITIFLMVVVVPVFSDVFSGMGGKLPTPTQYLINVSFFMKKNIILILAGWAGLSAAGCIISSTPVGRAFWDAKRIKLPIFGIIAHKICLARFARTMASLVRSGVPILEVLTIVQNTVGNVVMENALKTAAVDIERGEGISTALAKHPVFPVMIIRMLTAGEQTGKIDNMLERVADFLDEEIKTTLDGLTSLIEPLLIVFLGVVVGGIVDLHVPAHFQVERSGFRQTLRKQIPCARGESGGNGP
jgi:type IV pilus assembly protein PilC